MYFSSSCFHFLCIHVHYLLIFISKFNVKRKRERKKEKVKYIYQYRLNIPEVCSHFHTMFRSPIHSLIHLFHTFLIHPFTYYQKYMHSYLWIRLLFYSFNKCAKISQYEKFSLFFLPLIHST